MLRLPLVLAVSIAVGVSLTACMMNASHVPAYVTAAVADPSRPDADKARDANRKPAQTLLFLEVRPGEKIGELMPGGGYFTRILSKAVGANGKVFALAPQRPKNAPVDLPDMAEKVKVIAADPNYSNVTVIVMPLSKLAAPQPVDLYFTAQNYHDFHNIPGFDVGAFNRGVFAAVKPGGLFVVLDHSAEKGSGTRDTSLLHRIDEETVKSEVEAAGFKFVSESMLLANPDDPRTAKVFDPSIRGKTDQFILKFRKPKG